jgi:outer membrane protein OmpA-like peptidoglycan-associated protein
MLRDAGRNTAMLRFARGSSMGCGAPTPGSSFPTREFSAPPALLEPVPPAAQLNAARTPLSRSCNMITKSTLLCLAFAALASSAFAQNVVHYREGQAVDPQDVAQILNTRVVKTRSLRLLDQPVSEAANAKALSLPVHFGFDSAKIDPSARGQLDALAAGIKLLPSTQKVIVEGHTDSIGSDSYNLLLSQKRAAAVKEYLVSVHGIDATRLKDVGYGFYRPIEGLAPAAAENRRVQFHGE